MANGTPQTTAAPTAAPAPGAAESEQMQQLMTRLMGRAAQPRMQGPQATLTPSQQSLMQPDPHPMRLTHGLFGLISSAAQHNKQTQLAHATQRIQGISDAIAGAYEKATDPMTGQVNEQKAQEIFKASAAVQSLLSKEGLKDVKQMEKLLQYDFLNPEKSKTVWHEALEKVAKISGAERVMKGLRTIMGQHKDKMAEEVRKQGEAQKQQQEGRDLAGTMFKEARPEPQNAAVAMQEAKVALQGEALKAREIADNMRAQLAEERNKTAEERNKLLEAQNLEKANEFDRREKRLDQAHKDLLAYRADQLKVARERLAQAGADKDLRRLVTALNYAPQLLKPGEAESFGMQLDEEGNLVPLKSPLSATTQTKNTAQQAKVMDGLVGTTLKMLDSPDLQEKLGPFQGRISEIMAGKIGLDVPEFSILRTLGTFDASGMLRLHFGARGGQQQYEKFKNLIDTGKMDVAALRESLQGFEIVIQNYKGEFKTVRGTPKGGAAAVAPTVIDLDHPKAPGQP